MKNITVIGAGTMGNGIAHVFAQAGFTVNIVDVSLAQLDRAIVHISKNLDRQIAKGAITEEQKKITLSNISIHPNMTEGVMNAELVVEAATENEELKLEIFEQLSKLVSKETILASNTSSISITKIATATSHPDKVIGMHFMNPVPVMKLVEIINGYATSKEVTEKIVTLSKQLG
ncbi:MAG: 3-hydroxybutyryl-CoA dehydrogenase, partial [Chitinophagaceae bacterium]|nr:3-hydroxybutyryl-CoA dehydrogenase [Chitinophagaceae bacterium]